MCVCVRTCVSMSESEREADRKVADIQKQCTHSM